MTWSAVDKEDKNHFQTAPGGARINANQRMNLDKVKNQYSSLHGSNGSKGNSEGSVIKRSSKEEERINDDTKNKGGHNEGKTMQEEKKQGAEDWMRAHVTPDRTTREGTNAVGGEENA